MPTCNLTGRGTKQDKKAVVKLLSQQTHWGQGFKSMLEGAITAQKGKLHFDCHLKNSLLSGSLPTTNGWGGGGNPNEWATQQTVIT